MGINGDGSERMSSWQRGFSLGVLLLFLVVGVAGVSLAATGAEPELRRELELLKARMEQDRQRVERLEHQFQSVATQSDQQSKALEEKVAQRLLNQSTFGQYLDRFAGEPRLSIVGYGFSTFEWQERANTNTFSAALEPIFLYRLSDRLLFEGDLELKLEDTETSADLEYAQVDYLLNDYLTVVAGKF